LILGEGSPVTDRVLAEWFDTGPDEPFDPAPSHVLLYDAECGFCDATVQLVMRYDRQRTLYFASLQSRFAKSTIGERQNHQVVDSVIWVDLLSDNRIVSTAIKSDAILRIARYLGGLWRLLLLVRVVPRPIRDRVYDVVARNRYRLGLAADTCVLPSPDQMRRFLA